MRFPIEISRGRRFDVLGFGTNSVDYLISVPEYPRFAGKVELREYVKEAGGEIASTMAGLQRLGLRTAYAGSFGDDDAGAFGLETLVKEGVDVSLSKTVAGASTQIAFIVIDDSTGERTVIWKRDRRLTFSPDEIPANIVADASILHMTAHDTEACIKLAEAARSAGTIVSLDADNLFPRIEELLPFVDVLICSSEFPSRLTGKDDLEEALSSIGEKYKNAVSGVTLGSAGSLLRCGGEFIRTDGFDVPGGCRDTTGAGDAFRTGLLYGLWKGETVENAAQMANALAALKCRAVGARTSLPRADELDRFLKNP
jgi:sugar/nucleoside kinase (ribokinase family)